MDYLKELINNKGKGTNNCSKILGSEARVAEIAAFYEQHAELMHLIAANGLLDFSTKPHNQEEMAAFNEGISYIGSVMHGCLALEEAKRLQKESKD